MRGKREYRERGETKRGEREREREKRDLHLGLDIVKTRNSTWVSYVGGRNKRAQEIICSFLRCICRNNESGEGGIHASAVVSDVDIANGSITHRATLPTSVVHMLCCFHLIFPTSNHTFKDLHKGSK